MNIKICIGCGAEFSRTLYITDYQWRAQRYCSRSCGARYRSRVRHEINPHRQRLSPEEKRRRLAARTYAPVLCECGNPPTHIAWVDVLTEQSIVRGPLPLCADCADLMAQDEPHTHITPYVGHTYHTGVEPR